MRPPRLRSEAGHRAAPSHLLFVVFVSLALFSCGGGTNSSSSSPQQTASSPSITSQPQSQTVTEPDSASFAVEASGTPPIAFQWNKNGLPIPGATSSTYTTSATSAADNGTKFTVTLTNGAGSIASNTAVLTVNLSAAMVNAIVGSGQSTYFSNTFATDLQATVTDVSGNPIPNEQVTFGAPSTGASATFANGTNLMTATTDANGVATTSALTANRIAGSYAINASVAGVTLPAIYSLTNLSTAGGGIPHFAHVLLVLEENHSYTDVMGNANMPYLNGLASANSRATQYYADAHPSLPNYFELTVGEGTSITGTQGDSFTGVVTQDNVVRALTSAGKTWKSYAESLPSAGYLGGDNGAYLQHHNPFVYFSDVQQNVVQAGNVVPFTQFASDIARNALPDYAFIVPNVNDDAHNCPIGMSTCTDDQKLAAADQWLSTNISPLLASAAFQNSLLIIVFDESKDTDLAYGGGHVPAVLVSPLVRAGYQSTTLYQHESVLRLVMEGLGVTDLPGAAATAPGMTEFFP